MSNSFHNISSLSWSAPTWWQGIVQEAQELLPDPTVAECDRNHQWKKSTHVTNPAQHSELYFFLNHLTPSASFLLIPLLFFLVVDCSLFCFVDIFHSWLSEDTVNTFTCLFALQGKGFCILQKWAKLRVLWQLHLQPPLYYTTLHYVQLHYNSNNNYNWNCNCNYTKATLQPHYYNYNCNYNYTTL